MRIFLQAPAVAPGAYQHFRDKEEMTKIAYRLPQVQVRIKHSAFYTHIGVAQILLLIVAPDFLLKGDRGPSRVAFKLAQRAVAAYPFMCRCDLAHVKWPD